MGRRKDFMEMRWRNTLQNYHTRWGGIRRRFWRCDRRTLSERAVHAAEWRKLRIARGGVLLFSRMHQDPEWDEAQSCLRPTGRKPNRAGDSGQGGIAANPKGDGDDRVVDAQTGAMRRWRSAD